MLVGLDDNIKRKTILSVIVPVYNSEKYLDECIKSIKNQTFKDWELILVDDGSTDKSVNICKMFSASDCRIKFFCQNHAGASAARVKGIENSTGEYITFVDSDDWLEQTMLDEVMSVMLIDKNIDIMVCSYSRHNGIVQEVMCYEEKKIKIDSAINALELIFEEKEFTWSLWGNFYKKNLFHCNDFIHDWWPPTYGDDTYVNWHVVKNARKVAFIYSALYHYRVHRGSLMHKKIDKSRLIYFDIYDKILCQIEDLHSRLARNIIMAMSRIGLSILHELIIYEGRDDAWYRSYDIFMKYMRIYDSELDTQQKKIYRLLSMSDCELQHLRKKNIHELQQFCDKYEYVFIYGAGKYALEVASIMEKEQMCFRGFVVTNKKDNVPNINGYDVCSYENIKKEYGDLQIGIVTGLGEENLAQVRPILKQEKNWGIFVGTRLNLRTV